MSEAIHQFSHQQVLETPQHLLQQSFEQGVDSSNPGFTERFFGVFHEASQFIADNPRTVMLASVAIGAVVGAWQENKQMRKIEKNRQSLNSVWANVTEPIRVSKHERAIRSVLSLAFVGGGLIGAANAQAWTDSANEQVVQPQLELVVDKSGVTALGEQEPAIAIQEMLGQIRESFGQESTTARVAAAAEVTPMTVEGAIDFVPFGDAPMTVAFQNSVNQINVTRQNLEIGERLRNSAVLVLTNGNKFTDRRTTELALATNSPVFVFDVAEEASSQQQPMKDIASRSGGLYVDLTQMDTVSERGALVQEIKQVIENADTRGESRPNWANRLAIFGLSVASVMAWRITRPTLTSRFGFKARKEE